MIKMDAEEFVEIINKKDFGSALAYLKQNYLPKYPEYPDKPALLFLMPDHNKRIDVEKIKSFLVELRNWEKIKKEHEEEIIKYYAEMNRYNNIIIEAIFRISGFYEKVPEDQQDTIFQYFIEINHIYGNINYYVLFDIVKNFINGYEYSENE